MDVVRKHLKETVNCIEEKIEIVDDEMNTLEIRLGRLRRTREELEESCNKISEVMSEFGD